MSARVPATQAGLSATTIATATGYLAWVLMGCSNLVLSPILIWTEIYPIGTYCPVLVGELNVRLIFCADVGEDIGSFVGFICCIWLYSCGQLGMSSPDLSHTHFCP